MMLRRVLAPVVLTLVLVSTSGCALFQAVPTEANPTATPTVAPTPTATPTSIPTPTRTPAAPATPEVSGLEAIPDEPGQEFTVEVTQEEINRNLAGQSFDQDGLLISEPEITLAEGNIIGRFMVLHEQTGLSFPITVRGEPNVVDGELYFRVEEITLDESVGGIRRLLIQSVLDQTQRQMADEAGIRIPLQRLDDTDIEEVEVQLGTMIISGTTREPRAGA